jgi:hypothetical protein
MKSIEFYIDRIRKFKYKYPEVKDDAEEIFNDAYLDYVTSGDYKEWDEMSFNRRLNSNLKTMRFNATSPNMIQHHYGNVEKTNILNRRFICKRCKQEKDYHNACVWIRKDGSIHMWNMCKPCRSDHTRENFISRGEDAVRKVRDYEKKCRAEVSPVYTKHILKLKGVSAKFIKANPDIVDHQIELIQKTRACKSERKYIDKFTKDGSFIKRYESIKDIEMDGYDKRMVWRCCSGSRGSYSGFKWKYSS